MGVQVIDIVLRVASVGYMFFMALGKLAMSPLSDLLAEGFGTVTSPFISDMSWTYDLSVLGFLGDIVGWFGEALQHVLGNGFLADYTVLEGFLFLSAISIFFIALGRLFSFVLDILDLIIPG